MTNIIDFEKVTGDGETDEDELENLVLSFDEFQTITDDRLALAKFTTLAKRLIDEGMDANIVYHALYRAGAFMACQDEEHYHKFTTTVHDELTRVGTHLCKERLKKSPLSDLV